MQKENQSNNRKEAHNSTEDSAYFFNSRNFNPKYVEFLQDDNQRFSRPSFSKLPSFGIKKTIQKIEHWFETKYNNLLDLFFNWLKSLPWVRIALVAFIGFIVIKDFNFSVKFKSPEEIFIDDRDHGETMQVFPSNELKPALVSNKTVINPQAPVNVSAYDKSAMDYIDRFGKTAIQEMKKYSIPASITLAQGLIESNAGRSNLARKNNNHFGIKCFSKNCPKDHCANFSDDHHKDFFRKFRSAWASYRAHSKLLANGRYKDLSRYGNDYKKWAMGLKQLGYATDKNYDKKLINTIEKFQLHRFDDY